MTNLIAASAAALFLAASAQASGLEQLVGSDAAFANTVSVTLAAFEAKDTLRETPECAALDRKYFRQFSLAEAVKLVQPCLDGVAKRSGIALQAELGVVSPAGEEHGPVMGIVIVAPDVSVASQGMRDLSRSLDARGWELLGHRVKVARAGEMAQSSAVQKALDGCIMPSVLRKIESGADFIKYYGRCITSDSSLKVRELRPSPGHQFGVLAVSSGDQVVVESINGAVSINAESGPVRIIFMAYPESYSLPK